jgi:outer membrane receptor protein involved in Fe transport
MNLRRVALLALSTSLAIPSALVAPERELYADDLADEADLHFRLGTESYNARDFRGALEHFLASNRLVRNRNVVFNIARTYEQLAQYADAHRYYTQAIDMERDQGRLTQINEAVARIRPYVAVLRVVSDPPGATVYINRRDLGPRGTAPRSLAFPPGRYRVIAELDGYEPVESPEVQAALAQETLVTLRMVRIVGNARVEGEASGAVVHVDSPDGVPAGRVPCDLVLAPGRHRFFVSREGYATSEQDVDVVARSTVTVRPRLTPLTGNLVINTDERDALVEVDGRPVGFTPVVVSVPVGRRRVRISLTGFRTIEQNVDIRNNEQTRLSPELRQIEEVEAASRTAEAVEDAPSSVTIIPGQELRAMGYPTIAEALRGVRGVFVSDDRFYPTVGFRGFSRMGDIGNRVLVLINGQPTNDNWGFFSYVGYDARVDLDDVERIEVVRGPGSVLYGTGAVSGVINVVTRGRDARPGVGAAASTVEGNITRARAHGVLRFGNNAGAWASVSGATSSGRNFVFPELVEPAMGTNPGFDGSSAGADGFDALTTQGRAWAGAFSAQWLLSTRTKQVPTGIAGTLLGDPRTYNSDTRGLLELRFEPRLSDSFQFYTRAALNHYNFIGSYAYGADMNGVASALRERWLGTWATAEMRAVWSPITWMRLMIGAEAQYHFQAQQRGQASATGCTAMNRMACAPTLYLPSTDTYRDDLYDPHPFLIAAGYLLADLNPSRQVRLSAGVRYDQYFFFAQNDNPSRSFGAFSPRLAVVLRPYESGNLKVMAGRAFRAPSVYEQFYNDGFGTRAPSTYAPAMGPPRALSPETMWSGEIEFTHRFSSTWTGTVAAFANYYDNFIIDGTVAPPAPATDDISQYQNSSDAPVLTVGGEAELRREWRQGWMLSASYSFQRSLYLEANGVDNLRNVPNSPEHLASLRGAMPILGRQLMLSTRISFEGPRWDRHDKTEDTTAQGRTDPGLLWDVVFSGQEQRAGLRYALGLYNILDWQYSLPVAALFAPRAVPQNGRTLFLSVGLNF